MISALRQKIRRAAHVYKAVGRQHHKPLLKLLKAYVPDDAVVFDVGGHAGQFAKLFSQLAPQGAVFVFEPARYARSILQIMAGVKDLGNVFVLPFGLGATPGRSVINVPVKKKGSIGFGLSFVGDVLPQDQRFATLRREPIFIATVDAMAELLRLDRLDFIKADIEGFELFMLQGAQETLKKFHPVLLLELTEKSLSRHGQTVAQAMDFLSALGYTAFTADEKAGTIAPAASAGEGGDFLFLPRDKVKR